MHSTIWRLHCCVLPVSKRFGIIFFPTFLINRGPVYLIFPPPYYPLNVLAVGLNNPQLCTILCTSEDCWWYVHKSSAVICLQGNMRSHTQIQWRLLSAREYGATYTNPVPSSACKGIWGHIHKSSAGFSLQGNMGPHTQIQWRLLPAREYGVTYTNPVTASVCKGIWGHIHKSSAVICLQGNMGPHTQIQCRLLSTREYGVTYTNPVTASVYKGIWGHIHLLL